MSQIVSRDSFFITLLIIITVMTTYDLIHDYQEGTPIFHLLIELLVVVSSVIGIGFLIKELTKHRHDLEVVKEKLTITREELSESREHVKAAGKEFMKAINQQFDSWTLTPSEREVATLLLKGLSFEEISTVRNTKEKTVRQQASSIYRKSGLSGRHEFAAWFFEDLLQ
ncbi:MAG: LuxR C-terminal-related transcriptional regulator [Thiolinea sp.]